MGGSTGKIHSRQIFQKNGHETGFRVRAQTCRNKTQVHQEADGRGNTSDTRHPFHYKIRPLGMSNTEIKCPETGSSTCLPVCVQFEGMLNIVDINQHISLSNIYLYTGGNFAFNIYYSS